MPIKKSAIGAGIPFGDNSKRPADPQSGQPFFNGDAARLELYTSTVGWQNIVQETPAVVSVSGTYKESSESNTILINGNNFAVGAVAFAIGTDGVSIQADTTSLISVVQVSSVFSGLTKANEPYDIKLVNPSNLYGILYECLPVDETPIWISNPGSLGTYNELVPLSISLYAEDPELTNLSFSVSSGSLPAGLSIGQQTGVISGTPSDIIPNTTYSFTVDAYDGQNHSYRQFSMTISDRGPSWTTSQTLPIFSKNVGYSTTLSATDDNGILSYTIVAGSLPSGMSLNQSTGQISGITQSDTSAIFTVRATDNGGNVSDRQFILPNIAPAWTTSGTLPAANVGTAYSYQLVATDDSVLQYSLQSGSLPAGLSISSSGLISGTPTLSGSFTFYVNATDQNGSTTSSQLSIASDAIGGVLYQTPGSYTFTVPSGVTSVSVVAIGGGQGGGGSANSAVSTSQGGGAGGGLSYGTVSVTPGQQISVAVGSGGSGGTYKNSGNQGGTSSFGSFIIASGGSGNTVGAIGNPNATTPSGGSGTAGTSSGTNRSGGGSGGTGGVGSSGDGGGGGGGAGGYSGNGGLGGGAGQDSGPTGLATAGTGGGGGGGAGGPGGNDQAGSGGGGTGVYGIGSNGTAGGSATTWAASSTVSSGGGGGGSSGNSGTSSNLNTPGVGGTFGGGGGGGNGNDDTSAGGSGGSGAVRIIWGMGRSFPSTNVNQNYNGFAETVV